MVVLTIRKMVERIEHQPGMVARKRLAGGSSPRKSAVYANDGITNATSEPPNAPIRLRTCIDKNHAQP